MDPQKKMLMIINPISGGIDKTDLVDAVLLFAENNNKEIITFETTGKDDEAEIVKLFKQHEPDRILVAGGDGTIKIVAEALHDTDFIMGILPAGSANGLSVDLKLPSSLEENLPIAFNNTYMEMDMVSINGIKSLHLSDIGVNAELIKNYESSSIRGKWGYALQAINTLRGLQEPFEAVVKANNRVIQTKARMIVIANTQKYGTGVTINPVGVMNDGKFEIIILKCLDIFLIGKILSGNMPLESEDLEIVSTDSAQISTNIPVAFQVDGEFCGEINKLDIKIIHKKLKVAIP